jgi:hypothetical protein
MKFWPFDDRDPQIPYNLMKNLVESGGQLDPYKANLKITTDFFRQAGSENVASALKTVSDLLILLVGAARSGMQLGYPHILAGVLEDRLVPLSYKLTQHLQQLTQETCLEIETLLIDRDKPKVAATASLTALYPQMSHVKDVWPHLDDALLERWVKYSVLAADNLKSVIIHLDPTARNLKTAASRISSTLLKEHVEAIREGYLQRRFKYAEESGEPLYIEETEECSDETRKFITEILSEFSHGIRQEFLYHASSLFMAKVVDDNLLASLSSRFKCDKMRTPYSFSVLSLPNRDYLLFYEEFVFATDPDLLNEVRKGTLMTKKLSFWDNAAKASHKARKRKAATQKVAAVIRCTFTSNSLYDTNFVDWLRTLGARKMGPSTWDLPYTNNAEMQDLKSKLKCDWGYPYAHEMIESPGRATEMFRDIGTGFTQHFASLVRLAVIKDQMVLRQEKKSWVVRSEDPSSKWNGGCFPTKEEALKRQAQLLLRGEEARSLHAMCSTNTPRKANAVLSSVLEIKSAMVDEELVESIGKIADELKVAHSFLFSKHAVSDPFDPNCVLLTPSKGSVVHAHNKEYKVTRITSKLKHGWFEAVDTQDGQDVVFTVPDENSNCAIIPAEEAAPLDPSMGNKTMMCVPDTSACNVTTVVVFTIDGESVILNDDEQDGGIYPEEPAYCRPMRAEPDDTEAQIHVTASRNVPTLPCFDPLKPGKTVLYFSNKILSTRPLREDEHLQPQAITPSPINNLMPYDKQNRTVIMDRGVGDSSITPTQITQFEEINRPDTYMIDDPKTDPVTRLKKHRLPTGG